MENEMPTIKEIAKRLKVSISTVSRALSNHPRIGLQTKALVQDLVKELGYEPNSLAISFKRRKTFIIGVILPYIREDFFSQAISGIEAAAIENEYTILFGQSYDNLDKEKILVDIMRKHRVDGILISLSKTTQNYDHFQALDKFGIPIVFFDRVPNITNAHKVYCNLYKGTIEMIGWLLGRGYKRIAMINGPQKLLASKERLSGYIEGISRKKLKVDMQLVENTDLSKESTCKAVQKLLSLKKIPDAIISFNDYVHMDVVQYAYNQNLQINKDIAFVSYANLPITGYMAHPPLVSIEQYAYGQGEKAMEIMMRILNDKAKNLHDPNHYYNEEVAGTLVMNQSIPSNK